ncbi:uncharacterized protein A1O9_01710 [Exophiala aquamarina CBS 119918]|uniref:Heterokaryon incompatibility domain-containing protein n=1 Tax=Exophiala aquamarina CBS 119918 TaxID=1182545 RepID=A0A072PVH3_9EURO|nr:uncharacterized protein A1O9_01710 [Exophiala aquamarina CBS 119918]KEF63732.1 hypothetical protein A1O9_01710 [Exophiala aquamarina CBS 119918]
MRLLNTLTLELVEFFESDIPEYAILSHTWESEEIAFKEMKGRSPTCQQKKGYQKIQSACAYANKNGYQYIWIDTCCIDKRSSSELSEAINSMYRWYEDAKICYAYLTDVPSDDRIQDADSHFRNSRWFTRGWTLQELIAPQTVHFISQDWKFIDTRVCLRMLISEITSIPVICLRDPALCAYTSIATRMSWASGRNCSRGEDSAYCLLGLFNVNMPLLYGEGDVKAFVRLQEEVIKTSDDRSIFIWSGHSVSSNEIEKHPVSMVSFTGIFAATAKWFEPDHRSQFSNPDAIPQHEIIQPYHNTNQGLFIQVELCHIVDDLFVAGIAGASPKQSAYPAGILLLRADHSKNQYVRIRPDQLIDFGDDLQGRAKIKSIYISAFHNQMHDVISTCNDGLNKNVELFLSRRPPSSRPQRQPRGATMQNYKAPIPQLRNVLPF